MRNYMRQDNPGAILYYTIKEDPHVGFSVKIYISQHYWRKIFIHDIKHYHTKVVEKFNGTINI